MGEVVPIYFHRLMCARLGCSTTLDWQNNTKDDTEQAIYYGRQAGWQYVHQGGSGSWLCPEHRTETYHHRLMCAAYVNGCNSVLIWKDTNLQVTDDIPLMNSWWLDHGKWVCSAHLKTKEEKMDNNTPEYLPMATSEDEALRFQLKGLKIVRDYVQKKLDKSDPAVKFQAFPVWFSKTLQNWKMLVSTTLDDQMYYEVTYNGDLGETYVDAYKKWENVKYLDGWDDTNV